MPNRPIGEKDVAHHLLHNISTDITERNALKKTLEIVLPEIEMERNVEEENTTYTIPVPRNATLRQQFFFILGASLAILDEMNK